MSVYTKKRDLPTYPEPPKKAYLISKRPLHRRYTPVTRVTDAPTYLSPAPNGHQRIPLPGREPRTGAGAAFLPGTRVNELACAAQGKPGPVFANLIFASTIFLHLFLLSLPSSPFSPLASLSMQIGLSLHAHAINPQSDTHAHVQQSTRWGMCPRSPPPPPPHRHPRLPGAHEAAASLQQPSPMRVR